MNNNTVKKESEKKKRVQANNNCKEKEGEVLCADFAMKGTDLWTVKSSRGNQ